MIKLNAKNSQHEKLITIYHLLEECDMNHYMQQHSIEDLD